MIRLLYYYTILILLSRALRAKPATVPFFSKWIELPRQLGIELPFALPILHVTCIAYCLVYCIACCIVYSYAYCIA